MGEQIQAPGSGPEERALFTSHLLADLQALERLIAEGRIESGVRRVGAEQEVFLVDSNWRPAPIALEVLEALEDSHYTTELALFNLEFNLDPLELAGGALSHLEADLDAHLKKLRRAAQSVDCEALLIGCLPTLTAEHLTLDFMTPKPRYRALNDAVRRLRGEDFQLRIRGRDELVLRHDNVMPEACNTSFQVHYQVGAEEFARKYNVAQLVAAPVLAVATNSPILLDRQLWAETRIALFQQSTDARSSASGMRKSQPRVSFGSRWLERSVLEIFQEDVARFRVLLGNERSEDPAAVIAGGEAPELYALRQHNGTVYRWNRPCYGVNDGVAHLRIENRVLPAGPTVVDEVANAAFWLGLMEAGDEAFGDFTERLSFDDARRNFLAAARNGLETDMVWLDGGRRPAREVLGELLAVAHRGLESLEIDAEDRSRYLGVIEERTANGQTGSRWLCDFSDSLATADGPRQSMAALVAGVHRRQIEGSPGHRWAGRRDRRPAPRRADYRTVGDIMSTDLITVGPNQPVELAASIMRWRRFRHLPVENRDQKLLGLVSERSLLGLLAKPRDPDAPPLVRDVMSRELVTATPETDLAEAIHRMRTHRISCLPVVDAQGLPVGILSERDLVAIAAPLLDRFLAADEPSGGEEE